MNIDKSVLGIAGEFAVASEMCRRNIYAQLTLGNQKRIDLLTLSPDEKFLKIEVKTKQGPAWPNVKGLAPGDAYLVLVDFANKHENERPDFYVLSRADWQDFAQNHVDRYLSRHPERSAHLDDTGCPIYPEELNYRGKPYRGCSIRPAQVEAHRDAWHKILEAAVLTLTGPGRSGAGAGTGCPPSE